MSELSDVQLQAALGAQREAWADHTVGETTRQDRIGQTTERLRNLLETRAPLAVQESVVAQPPLSLQARLLAAIEAEKAARRKNDAKALRQITTEIIELQADIRRTESPETK